jgi:hypothetical protein
VCGAVCSPKHLCTLSTSGIHLTSECIDHLWALHAIHPDRTQCNDSWGWARAGSVSSCSEDFFHIPLSAHHFDWYVGHYKRLLWSLSAALVPREYDNLGSRSSIGIFTSSSRQFADTIPSAHWKLSC